MSRSLSFGESNIQSTDQVTLLRDVETDIELKQPCVRYRYLTAILASLGFIMAQGTRTSLNIALVAMVNYTAESPFNSSQFQCPQSHTYHNKTIPQNQGEFDWDGTIQSQLLSAFYYGYVITQIPGGYLAERVGSTLVFGLTVLVPGILSLLHPLLARWDYRSLLAARVLMGICQGPLFPSNQALWGRWAPPLERSRLMSLSTAGSFIGVLTSLVLTGYLCSLPYLGGWPLPFYVWGFPIYMKQALGFDISLEGQLTAMPPLASVIVALLTSVLADYLLSKHWLSTTAVRKIFTFIGECSMALAVIGVGLADCDRVLVVLLYIIGYGLSGFTASGISVITLDMAPQYAGTLLGITNVINSCGGFLSPALVRLVTDNQGDKYRWQLMFYITGGFYMLGLLVFTFLGSAEIQPWAVIPVDSDAPDSDDSGGDGDATGVNNNGASTEESAGDTEQLIL
ncbi:hypothetical protein LSH36_1002g01003 [Paralvinella palmiformis]|uniref:Major facilitator superfamily (MFS) profile domain-containing protein n=1 Tax=Paralvinella palmiformis TaxID=53620 RepID=A0AAD9IX98_9ANNE|nr:hypothetical protein LSH36_1002g01003 [Paralvinella palmiformis]